MYYTIDENTSSTIVPVACQISHLFWRRLCNCTIAIQGVMQIWHLTIECAEE